MDSKEHNGPDGEARVVCPFYLLDMRASAVEILLKRLARRCATRAAQNAGIETTRLSSQVWRGLGIMNSARGVTPIHRQLLAYVRQRKHLRQARANALVPYVAAAGVLPPVLVRIVLAFLP